MVSTSGNSGTGNPSSNPERNRENRKGSLDSALLSKGRSFQEDRRIGAFSLRRVRSARISRLPKPRRKKRPAARPQ